jgi:hypothetical protein
MKIKGVVNSGKGKSSVHMKRNLDMIQRKLGMKVISGSLNTKLEKRTKLVNPIKVKVPEYKAPYEFYRCVVNGLDMFIMRPPLAKQHSKAELVYSERLRDIFKLKDGMELIINISEDHIEHYSLAVSVMAVPKREDMVLELVSSLGIPNSQVAWEDGSGIWNTRCKAMKKYGPKHTHILVLQDDAIPCEGLIEKVEDFMEEYPDDIISFYTGKRKNLLFMHKIANKISFAQGNTFSLRSLSWGVAVLMPVKYVEEVIDFWDDKEEYLKHDDTRIGKWCFNVKQRDILYSIPSLVNHRIGESTVGDCGTDRVAYNFIGGEK